MGRREIQGRRKKVREKDRGKENRRRDGNKEKET